MAERLQIHVSWGTLMKIGAAIVAFLVWRELMWVVLLLAIAVIIAVALDPVVRRLEARGVPRGLASWALVALIVGTICVFLVMTWSSLVAQAQHVGQQLAALQRTVQERLPKWMLEIIHRSETPDASTLGPYALAFGRSALSAFAAFVLAWILVAYLLIEADMTYRWVRGFVPERHRRRFDKTACEAREAALGYVVGNFTTSVCAGIYFYVWLAVLHVPAALLLALLAFLADFIPVVGFFLSCGPAIAMAATQSATTALMMVPIYMAYHVIENYIIAPRVYGTRLRLSNLAVLLAFAVGAELFGVAGALIALPVAAVYPTIERLWLRDAFGDDVVEEHEAVARESRDSKHAA